MEYRNYRLSTLQEINYKEFLDALRQMEYGYKLLFACNDAVTFMEDDEDGRGTLSMGMDDMDIPQYRGIIKKLPETFPHIVFVLDVTEPEGEADVDDWSGHFHREYFKGSKLQEAKLVAITFPEFDEGKLA